MKTLGKVAGIIGFIILMAFAGSVGKIIGKSTIKNYEQGNADAVIEEACIETAKKLNSQLPIMVDPETRLDVTMCIGKQMHYKYTMVNYSEKDFDKEAFQNEMAAVLSKGVCNNETMVKMLKMGVIYNYNYFDKTGILFATINISENDCGL